MEFSSNLKKYIISIFTASTFIFSVNIFAGGFQLWEQDSGGIGDYHAGGAAEADTAATLFFNPAGATRLKQQQVSVGAAYIPLNVSFSGTVNSTVPVNPTSGDTSNIVPNFAYAIPFANHRFAFAFSVTTPFGLATNYPNTSPINLLATKTQLETINLNPSLAYAINQYISIGVGFDELYGKAIYDSDVFEPLDTGLTGWSEGYNAGVLIQFNPQTRIGVSYRSAITVDATGGSSSQTLGSPPVPVNTTASADFPLPATTIFSAYHQFTDRFTMMASAFYTQWSCFKELVINNLATPFGAGTVGLFENYRNTWNLAIGGKYKLNSDVSLLAGFGHDQTPTKLGYRDIRLPDNNRYAASLGFDIHPSKKWLLSFGWIHFFVPNTPIDNSLANDTSKTTTLLPPNIGVGSVAASVNVYGAQFTWNI